MKTPLKSPAKLFVAFIVDIPIKLGTIQSVVIHSIIFASFYCSAWIFPSQSDHIISLFTNLLSIEAIYLSVFIQLSVNRNNEHVEQIKEDVSELNENIDDIAEDMSELNENVDDIAEDVSEINENIDDIAEDVEELNEDENEDDKPMKEQVSKNEIITTTHQKLQRLQSQLENIQKEINTILGEI